MTEYQSARFDQLACAARCLIHFCNTEGHQITNSEFCDRYESYFTDLSDKYGLLEGQNFGRVCSDLPIGEPIGGDDNYEVILQHFVPGRKCVFVMSQINLEPGATDTMRHFSIITHMTA